MRFYFVVSIFAFGSLLLPLSPATHACLASPIALPEGSDKDSDLLLRLIVAEQNKNLAKITSLSMVTESEWLVNRPEIQSETKTTHTLIKADAGAYAQNQRRMTVTKGGKAEASVTTERFVLNHDYFACYNTASQPYLWEYKDIERTPDAMKDRLVSANLHPELNYAFGCNQESLALTVKNAESHGIDFDVSRSKAPVETGCYLVEVWRKDRLYPHPYVNLTIDPAQGYAVIHGVVCIEQTGAVIADSKVQMKEVAPGIWFPVRWEVFKYDPDEPDPKGGPFVLGHNVNKVTAITVNPDIQKNQFSWRALGIDPARELIRTDALGVSKHMSILSGELVPVNIAKKMENIGEK